MGIDFDRRIRRLEWMNRFLLVGLVLVVVGALSDHVTAEAQAGRIRAESIETRSLTVENPTYGKQSLKITVADNGMVTLLITDQKGETAVGLTAPNPVAEPILCLSYQNVCRVAIGAVYRGNQPEFSVQLRNKEGHPVWMPSAPNVFAPSSDR